MQRGLLCLETSVCIELRRTCGAGRGLRRCRSRFALRFGPVTLNVKITSNLQITVDHSSFWRWFLLYLRPYFRLYSTTLFHDYFHEQVDSTIPWRSVILCMIFRCWTNMQDFCGLNMCWRSDIVNPCDESSCATSKRKRIHTTVSSSEVTSWSS